jgi:arylformamidase
MTTTFSALDWRTMSQDERDLGFNNGVAVPESVAMVAGWEQRSADMRKRYPDHIDLRYGPRERNRIDFLKVRDRAPTLLFIHGGYWQARAKEVFTIVAEGPMAHGINVALIGYTLATFWLNNCRGLARRKTASWYPAGLPAAISLRWRCRIRR